MIEVLDIYNKAFPRHQWSENFEEAVKKAKALKIKWVSKVIEIDNETGEVLREKKIN